MVESFKVPKLPGHPSGGQIGAEQRLASPVPIGATGLSSSSALTNATAVAVVVAPGGSYINFKYKHISKINRKMFMYIHTVTGGNSMETMMPLILRS